ncbi:phosphopantetheine-binding protein [Trichlorobacter lovleyi]|uniref:phosphopantetheine-binding protein n=1 Tax=Trichlorobacter lovleyi TaxID=313985 RepID=UPI0024804A1B|nr:phosphopantetheine-binding protein [Trichlorobacter lovleyi]
MAATVDEMKELMLQIGMDKELVAGLDPVAPLAGQGVDSVDCPAFAVALENRYKVKISDSDSMQLRAINDFVAFVNRTV